MNARDAKLRDAMPPTDLEAERTAICIVMLRPAALDDLTPMLQPEDFYSPPHATIWRTLLSMHDAHAPIDEKLLGRRLIADGNFEAVKESLLEIAHSPSHHANLPQYAGLVRKSSQRRRLRDIGLEMVESADDPTADVTTIVGDAEQSLVSIQTGDFTDSPQTLENALSEALCRIQSISDRQGQAGLLTGLETFDENIGGLFPGELVVTAARPGVGKSALAMQVAFSAASSGRPVLFVTLEMQGYELATRLLCSKAGVSSKLVRTGELTPKQTKALSDAAIRMSKTPLHLLFRPGCRVADIRRVANRMKRQGLALLVVDYLQLITPNDRRIQRHEQVGQMTAELKRLAGELEIPVMVLAQLSRQAEEGAAPKLSHLRESGSIEQDADVVMLLHRKKAHEGDDVGLNAVLDIAKNRAGETGQIQLDWHPSETRFTCSDRPAGEPAPAKRTRRSTAAHVASANPYANDFAGLGGN